MGISGSKPQPRAQPISHSKDSWYHYEAFLQNTPPKPGDLLEFSRFGGTYKHWAVYEGHLNHQGVTDHWVIHFSGEPTDKKNAKIQRDRLREVAVDSSFRINNNFDVSAPPVEGKVIIERARSKLGLSNYHVGVNNCEHFAKWCRNEKHISQQMGLNHVDAAINSPPHPLISQRAWQEERQKRPEDRGNWMDNLSDVEREIVLDRMAEGYPDLM